MTFSVSIKKELDNDKTVTYKLKFIDSFRFMTNKLSDLVDNLFEIYKNNAKYTWKEEKPSHDAIFLDLKIIN